MAAVGVSRRKHLSWDRAARDDWQISRAEILRLVCSRFLWLGAEGKSSCLLCPCLSADGSRSYTPQRRDTHEWVKGSEGQTQGPDSSSLSVLQTDWTFVILFFSLNWFVLVCSGFFCNLLLMFSHCFTHKIVERICNGLKAVCGCKVYPYRIDAVQITWDGPHGKIPGLVERSFVLRLRMKAASKGEDFGNKKKVSQRTWNISCERSGEAKANQRGMKSKNCNPGKGLR